MSFSVTSTLIMDAARKRGWKVDVINEHWALYKIILPEGRHYYIRNITSIKSGSVNGWITRNKEILYGIASEIGVNIPATITVQSLEQANQFLGQHKRAVIKPTEGSHGDGITLNITDNSQLPSAIDYARQVSDVVLMQQQVEGDDYRLLYIGGSIAAAVIRKPAFVIGDGKNSIRKLIELENNKPKRGEAYKSNLAYIDLVVAERYLGKNIDRQIPANNEEIRVIGVANVGQGGVSIDMTHKLSDTLKTAGQKIVDHFNLGLGGVDFICDEANKPYLIEINTVPSLGLHEYPYIGEAQNTPDKFLDWLTNP
ncbi:MAG: ATP-grasp domain-containing protein [Patescibacteria group bacterium]